jgi:hypothetical protein
LIRLVVLFKDREDGNSLFLSLVLDELCAEKWFRRKERVPVAPEDGRLKNDGNAYLRLDDLNGDGNKYC